jgi:hypothetical protein
VPLLESCFLGVVVGPLLGRHVYETDPNTVSIEQRFTAATAWFAGLELLPRLVHALPLPHGPTLRHAAVILLGRQSLSPATGQPSLPQLFICQLGHV